MMVVMAVFFYKMAAGLCLYFIASTAWGLAEKKLLAKPKLPEADAGGIPPPTTVSVSPPDAGPPAAPGFFGRLKAKMEEMQRQADEQAKRQIRTSPGRWGEPERQEEKAQEVGSDCQEFVLMRPTARENRGRFFLSKMEILVVNPYFSAACAIRGFLEMDLAQTLHSPIPA